MESKNIEELMVRYDNAIENISMNFKLIEFQLGKRTLTDKEAAKMIEHYKNREEYELCDKIIKKNHEKFK